MGHEVCAWVVDLLAWEEHRTSAGNVVALFEAFARARQRCQWLTQASCYSQ